MSDQIFNILKPPKLSSFDVVRLFKKKMNIKKVGHFGTLDPFATGVLLIATNGATKLTNYVHEKYSKTYIASGKLGAFSDTGDLTGNILEDTFRPLDDDLNQLNQKFSSFVGDYLQAPHRVSAAKFQGKALYDWAREGIEIKKEKKNRHIFSLQVLSYRYPWITFRVEVSTGTYIRTLFEDMAEKLGTRGYLTSLVREKIGPHSIRESCDIRKNIPQGKDLTAFVSLPSIILSAEESIRYRNGIRHTLFNQAEGFYWIKDSTNQLLGMGEIEGTQVKQVFNVYKN
ncbi:MAG: tRNA pseudouridine(55) synthase TruB [Bacteriovoracaceae bacterium]|nr:tRNA pseudouridine(55) synthase TruB [Bacteriovoracaceae bacterium]